MGSLRLVEVPAADWLRLADELEASAPLSAVMQCSLRAQAHFGRGATQPARFWVPHDARGGRAATLVVQSPVGSTWASLSAVWPPALPHATLLALLRSLPTVAWRRPLFVRYVPRQLQAQMTQLIAELSEGVLPLRVFISMATFRHPGPSPVPPRMPDGYILTELKEKDRSVAIDEWEDRFTEKREAFLETCKEYPTLAAYKRTPGEGGEDELASFSLIKPCGEIGMTSTMPLHRRKGLAKIITSELVKVALRSHFNPLVAITETNRVSIEMHEKLGFKFVLTNSLLYYAPSSFDTDFITDYLVGNHPLYHG